MSHTARNYSHVIPTLPFSPERPRHGNALELLARFCRQAGGAAPLAQRLHPHELPPPYRNLLVHSQDMTSTLERFYGQRTGLRVLRREPGEPLYLREVVLTIQNGLAVEYGAIQIDLTWFAPEVRREILEERLPLGRLLQDHEIAYLSWPQGFYSFDCNDYVQAVLQMDRAARLYGRRNVLLNEDRRLLADVVEILSPIAERSEPDETAPPPTAACAERPSLLVSTPLETD